MLALQQSEPNAALRRIYFRLVSTSSGEPMTGASVSSNLRKNGQSSTPGGSVTEMGGGLYYYQASAADLDTVGSLIYTPSANGAYTFSYEAVVFAYAPTQPGLSAPANFAQMALDTSGRVRVQPGTSPGQIALTDGAVTLTPGERSSIASSVWSATGRTLTSFGSLISDMVSAVWSAAGRTLTSIPDSDGVQTLLTRLTAGRAGALDRIDVDVSSRATQAHITSSQSAIIQHGDSNWVGSTGGGGSSPWSAAQVNTVLADAAAARQAAVSADGKLSNSRMAELDKNLATVGDIPQAAAIAVAVRQNLSTELGRLDATITSRLAANGYIAPDNATLAQVASQISSLATAAALSAVNAALGDLTELVDTRASATRMQKLDSLTFTLPRELDVNVKSIEDDPLAGDGTENNPWRPR